MASDTNFVCLVCDKGFSSKKTLTGHTRYVCGIKYEQPCPCPVCSKVFKCEQYLKSHLRKAHKKPSANPCPHCYKVFSSERYLKAHILRHPKDGNGIVTATIPYPSFGLFAYRGNVDNSTHNESASLEYK
ncbi:unnamed protein product, partial [Meganyctiphanes norvegica]